MTKQKIRVAEADNRVQTLMNGELSKKNQVPHVKIYSIEG